SLMFSVKNNAYGSFSFYRTTNYTWYTSLKKGGISAVRSDFTPVSDSTQFFTQHFISCVLEDHQGNVLLGTFGDGVLFVPKMSTTNLITSEPGNRLISMTHFEEERLLFGSESGQLFLYDKENELETLPYRGERIDFLQAIDAENVVMNDGHGYRYNLKNHETTSLNISSLKDVATIGGNAFVFATNKIGFKWNLSTGERQFFDGLVTRHYTVGYDTDLHEIYAGTARGLAFVSQNKEPVFISYRGKSILADDITYIKGLMYVATPKDGLLAFSNGKLQHTWDTSTGLISNQILKVKAHQNGLVIGTPKGIQFLNTEGQPLKIIGRADGLRTNGMIDFEVHQNTLWVLNREGVQQVNLEDHPEFNYKPQLKVFSVEVNEKQIPVQPELNLKADQNKIAFELGVRNLRYNGETQYSYWLQGVDTIWQFLPAEQNKITFRSLPAGDYVFRAKAICRGNESEEVLVAFSIATHFWLSWWFYAGIAVLGISGVMVFYRNRMLVEQKQAMLINELNASKLTAIQAQMNPHFTFNALNSIQDLVLKGDAQKSYTYIASFADLLRETLRASDQEFVELEKEVERIQLYLELEKLRFKDTLQFQVETNGIHDILIPPMLIQPFIENALIHGLLHKKGDRKLSIVFHTLKKGTLQCVVTDNGIGMEASKIINRRRHKRHESFSVSSIHKRLTVLKELTKDENLGVVYTNLEANGTSTGTEVCLTLPFKETF
ncbi:MAG: histidine kinase, partial [Salibacteraceae bacterium]